MKDGQEWCGSRWRTNPPDGVLCLVATRRTLDINGHCCDYDRCAATKKHYNRTGVDRCLLLPEHAGRHLGSNGIYWD